MAGLVQVFDAYGNLASGYEGTFSFQHSRDTKVQTMDSLSQDFSKNTSLTTIASDVLLQITSEDTSDQMISVTYTLDGQEDLEIEKTFSVVSDVKAQLIRSSNAPMQVGGNTYELTALLLDGSNKIIPLDISLPIRSMSSDVHLPAGITFSQGR